MKKHILDSHLSKKDWIAALRSGEYKQTKGSLYNPYSGGYCCLGVAAKIAGFADEELANMSFWGNLPVSYSSMCKKFGVNTSVIVHMVALNDNGYSFDQIADYIEKEI